MERKIEMLFVRKGDKLHVLNYIHMPLKLEVFSSIMNFCDEEFIFLYTDLFCFLYLF